MVRETNFHCVVIPAIGPGIAKFGPVVSRLLLAAIVVKFLLKEAKPVPQAIAGQGQIAGGGRVQEAGRQTAQAAVTQSRILNVLHAGQVHAHLQEGLLQLVQNPQIIEVAVHQAANEIFCRKVVSLPALDAAALALGPVLADGHHHGLGQGLVELLGGGLLQGHVALVAQLRLRHFQNVLTIQIHKRYLLSWNTYRARAKGVHRKNKSNPVKKPGKLPNPMGQRVGYHTILRSPCPVVI